MRNIHNLTRNAVLFAIVFSGSGVVLAQVPGTAGVRSGRLNFQDTEYRLSEAFVNGAQITFDAAPPPSISFHGDGVISGWDGVNDYFAKIRISPDGSFSLESHGFAVTKSTGDAARMNAEAIFLNAMQSTRLIHIDTDGIVFGTEDQATRLKFTPTAAAQGIAELLNAELALVRFVSNGNEVALPRDVTVTLTFQDGGRFSGRSSVNNYAGVFTVMPDSKITLQLTTATQMAGPPELMALEKAYFDALPLVRELRASGGRVILDGDKTSMEFAVRSPR
jgi:heat shock protein HslJ